MASGFVDKHNSGNSSSLTNMGNDTNGDIGRLEACWQPWLAVAHVFSGMAQCRLVLAGNEATIDGSEVVATFDGR